MGESFVSVLVESLNGIAAFTKTSLPKYVVINKEEMLLQQSSGCLTKEHPTVFNPYTGSQDCQTCWFRHWRFVGKAGGRGGDV